MNIIKIKKVFFILLLILISSLSFNVLKESTSAIEEDLFSKEVQFFNEKNNLLKKLLINYDNALQSVLENKSFHNLLLKNENKDIVNEWFLTFLKYSPNVFQFRFINLEGNEIIRVEKENSKTYIIQEEKLQNKKDRYYFKESISLKDGETWYSKLDLNIEKEKIVIPYIGTLRIVKPVFINEKKYGILIININLNDFLDEIIKNEIFDIFIIDKYNNILRSNLSEYDWSKYIGEKDFNIDILEISNNSFKKQLSIKNEENLIFLSHAKKSIINEILMDKTIDLILYIILIFILILYIYEIILSKKRLKEFNFKLEEKIEEQTKKMKKTLAFMSKYVIYSRTDLNGIIIDVSDAFCKVSDYEPGEMLGQPQSIVRHPDMKKDEFRNLWKTIKSGKVWTGELKNLTKNGNYYWTDSTITPEFDKNGNIISYMSIRYDITLKKDFEEQYLKLIEQSKMAALGEMIGNIAHQWRQPLSIITTASSGLSLYNEKGELTSQRVNEYNKLILKNANYLSETIELFRNFINEKKEFKKVILQDRINYIIHILEATLRNNNIELINDMDLTPISIITVVGELDQVMINIINNAKDAFQNKEIDKPFIKLDLRKQKDKIIITVEDNAGGIDKELITKIFEPYFTTKHKEQGRGLGLHMSYTIIRDILNGQLYVKNTKYGAKFFIEIPT